MSIARVRYGHQLSLKSVISFFLLAQAVALPVRAQETAPPIEWRRWNKKLFADAKQTKRDIILDLNAKLRHWRHFMEKRAHAHPDVRRMINTGYLAAKVDQDTTPDLATRYGDWGWMS